MTLPRYASRSAALLAFAALAGCGDDQGATSADTSGSSTSNGSSASTTGAGGAGGDQPFVLSSSSFEEGETIPQEHECGPPAPVMGNGGNLTPALAWSAGPAGTQSYALVVRDVDAKIPQFPEGIIHWVIYDIPVETQSLPEGIAPGYTVTDPAGAKQAEIQGSGFFGYFGPCSPNSVNTYVFTLHAMPSPTLPGASMSASEADIAELIESTSLATAALSGES